MTLHYSSESNYKIYFFWSKELGSKLGMLVWEGDQKHLPPFIIQTRERREEWNVQLTVIGRQAGSAVDDRKLTAAGR